MRHRQTGPTDDMQKMRRKLRELEDALRVVKQCLPEVPSDAELSQKIMCESERIIEKLRSPMVEDLNGCLATISEDVAEVKSDLQSQNSDFSAEAQKIKEKNSSLAERLKRVETRLQRELEERFRATEMSVKAASHALAEATENIDAGVPVQVVSMCKALAELERDDVPDELSQIGQAIRARLGDAEESSPVAAYLERGVRLSHAESELAALTDQLQTAKKDELPPPADIPERAGEIAAEAQSLIVPSNDDVRNSGEATLDELQAFLFEELDLAYRKAFLDSERERVVGDTISSLLSLFGYNLTRIQIGVTHSDARLHMVVDGAENEDFQSETVVNVMAMGYMDAKTGEVIRQAEVTVNK